MTARRLVYQLMVMAPAMLMGALAIHERTFEDEFLIPAQSQLDHEQMNEYVPLMRRTTPLLADGPDPKLSARQNQLLRSTAMMWVEGAESGKLVHLHAAFHGDNVRDGAKGQIFTARSSLASQIGTLGRWHAAAGEYEQATTDLLTALRLGNVAKYSDLTSIALSNTLQRTSIEVIARMIPKLSASQRATAVAVLRAHLRRQKDPQPLVVMARRQFSTYEEMRGRQILPIEETANLGPRARRLLLASASEDLPVVKNQARIAVESQRHHKELVQELIRALEGKGAFTSFSAETEPPPMSDVDVEGFEHGNWKRGNSGPPPMSPVRGFGRESWPRPGAAPPPPRWKRHGKGVQPEGLDARSLGSGHQAVAAN